MKTVGIFVEHLINWYISSPLNSLKMVDTVEESLKYKILKWTLLISNISSLIVDILVVIGGKAFVAWFTTLPKDAEDLPIRLFSVVEAVICVIAIFAIIKRHFVAFSVHTALLILYFIACIFFTRVIGWWLWIFAFILVALTLWFLYLLYKLKMRLENPYGV